MSDYCQKHRVEYSSESGECPLCEREGPDFGGDDRVV